jgi:CRP-like cAMP-binding protein
VGGLGPGRAPATSAKLDSVPRSLLEALDDDLRRQVRQSSRRRRFARRQPLFYEGDPSDGMHLVESGWIAVRTAGPLGEDVTLAVVGPGESLGEQSLIREGGPRSASALALTAVETLYLSRVVFDELRRRRPEVDQFLVLLLDDRLQRLNARLTEVLFVSADQRVTRRLHELASGFGGKEIPLTQYDLATLAGTTRPTVNRVLRAAQAAGALQLGRGRIEVTDADLLERLSRRPSLTSGRAEGRQA